MTRKWIAPVAALLVAVVFVSGCGNQFTLGQGQVTVDGLQAGQLVLCGAGGEILQISGAGFLSEHGNEVIVEFTALQGTPFNGQASTQVEGLAVSDSLVEALIPQIQGAAELTLTVILPGTNFGISPPETIQLGGTLVGPFGVDDNAGTVTGNVTYNAAAPGVLLNDINSFCGDDESSSTTERRGWLGAASRALLFNNLSVATPPVGFEDDATPGAQRMTTATPASGERGTVTIQADGSYVYEPPLGYEGQDGFYYWVQEAGRPDPSRAFVSITVEKVVWFIRDTNSSSETFNGTGRFSDPFDSLEAFNFAQNAPPAGDPNDFSNFPPVDPIPTNPDNAPEEGDCIFIYENLIFPIYDGGIRLRDRQQLFGEGWGLFVNDTQIVPPGTGPEPNPTLTNTLMAFSGGESQSQFLPVITLADENVIRGIDIAQPVESSALYGTGIYGFEVSGPTLIDFVRIMDSAGAGIRLDSIQAGTIQVGDPSVPGFPRVEIIDSLWKGIEMSGPFQLTEVASTALNGGATLGVFETLIDDPDNVGIEAQDCNLVVDQCEIDGVGAPGFGADWGIIQSLQGTGTCSCSITNTAVNRTNEQDSDIGITLLPLFTGDKIIATIRNCLIRSPWQAVGLGPSFGQPGGCMILEMDDNTFERTMVPPQDGLAQIHETVWVRGNDQRETYITSMDNNYVIGNGIAGGAKFQYVTFDANANPGDGIQETQATGNTRFGQGALDQDRVVETSLWFEECAGDLRFEDLTIFQLGGDLTGIIEFSAAVLNLAFTNAPNVNVSPP